MRFPSADWFQLWTAEQAQREFSNFEFLGVGWYIEGEDTLLVLGGPSNKYWFYCWNGFDPRQQMKDLLTLTEYR